ncbi:MAG: hypothetical protein ABSH32_09265 [Bryobacteraceae bacterium]
MSIDRSDLHALLDRIPEGDLPVIRKVLLAVAVESDVAPVAVEGDLTDAARREIEAAEAYFDKGGRGISHEEILREFGLG